MRMSESDFQSKLLAARKNNWKLDDAMRDAGQEAPIDGDTEDVIEAAIDALAAGLRSGNQDCVFSSLAYMMQAVGKMELPYPG